MNPSLDKSRQQLKITQPETAGDFQFDPANACAEMRHAQAAWATVSLIQRLAVVRRFRHLLAEQGSSVAAAADPAGRRSAAEILTAEIIPLAEAARFLEREAAAILQPRRVGSQGRPLWLRGVTAKVRREPQGLILVIAPSNYPLFIPGVQVLQALVAGNAVLLKPGPNGSAAAREVARLLLTAGLPLHLFRVLPEFPEAAQTAIECGVDKVCFTGSAATGAQLLRQLAPHITPAVLELSGCDAVIVRADADLDLTVRALLFGLRLNRSETCIAPRRVLVARSVATEFEGRLTQALSGFPTTHCSPRQQERLRPLIHQALRQGAHLLAGKLLAGGEMVGPLVLAGANKSSTLLREDIFAPLLTIQTVTDDEEAVAFANDCPYALGATIFSRDEIGARVLAPRLAAGVVLINDLIAPTADARLPFGGRKFSGFGLTRGPEGLLEMTTTKVVSVHRGRSRPHFDEPQAGQDALFLGYLRAAHGRSWWQRLTAFIEMCRTAMRLKRAGKVHASRITNQP
jgi:acyl-CoA reductase-like NAD-dependent aldehyde dehydrogenase